MVTELSYQQQNSRKSLAKYTKDINESRGVASEPNILCGGQESQHNWRNTSRAVQNVSRTTFLRGNRCYRHHCLTIHGNVLEQTSSITSKSITLALKTLFARHGIPETVISDNGPQFFSEEFQHFADEYNFSHTTSSPHFPQSKGQAERGVKTVKKIPKDIKTPF